MVRPSLQFVVIALITIVVGTAHLLAKFIVAEGFGLATIIILILLAPTLSRYLD